MDDPERVAQLMRGFDRPWWFAGGWAIELFVGRRLREHGDLEVGLLREDQFDLREHLYNWDWCKAADGQWAPWQAAERIELPLF